MNGLIYISLLSFIGFYLYMFFVRESEIRKQRQKTWDNLKLVFDMTKEDEKKLYKLYCDNIPRHWFLGFIYPNF